MNVGGQLRDARESRGLTIAALAKTTRIQPRLLEAIERNDLSVVPSWPYARGFVAAFAREVRLNVDETVRQYFAQFDQEPVPQVPSPTEPTEAAPWRSWGPAIAAVALLLITAFLVSNRNQAPQIDESAAVGTSGTPHTSAVPVSSQGRVDPPAHGEDGFNTYARGAGLHVALQTDFPSWIAASVDGARQVYEIVPAGRTITLRGTREVAIRVGDAGAVHVSIAGRPPAPIGRRGEVRSIRLTTRDRQK